MNVKNKIFLFFFLFLLSIPTRAENGIAIPDEIIWENLIGRHLYLTEFGVWRNGIKVNSYKPSEANGNKGERIVFKNNVIMWLDAQDGDHYYVYSIENRYLDIYNNDGSINNRLYIYDVYYNSGSLYILVTDKYGIYRIFYIEK